MVCHIGVHVFVLWFLRLQRRSGRWFFALRSGDVSSLQDAFAGYGLHVRGEVVEEHMHLDHHLSLDRDCRACVHLHYFEGGARGGGCSRDAAALQPRGEAPALLSSSGGAACDGPDGTARDGPGRRVPCSSGHGAVGSFMSSQFVQ